MSGLTSIIIPTYNGLHLLRTCVEHIRAYTDVPYEIIVVDNGSRMEPVNIVYGKGFCLSRCQKTPASPSRNHGLRLALGDQLLPLNNDVLFRRGG